MAPERLAHPSEEGWRQAFSKLDATLMHVRAVAANHREVEAWGKLIYVANVPPDGYIEDECGAFDWFPSDDEVFTFTTDLLRSVGTFLYGRRLYEAMAVLRLR